MPQYKVDEVMDLLEDSSLLTAQQAKVYTLRSFAGLNNKIIAKGMKTSESTVSEHYHAAREKIESARQTVEILEEINGKNPGNCAFCGEPITEPFVTSVSEEGTRIFGCSECIDTRLTERGRNHVENTRDSNIDQNSSDDDELVLESLSAEEIERHLSRIDSEDE